MAINPDAPYDVILGNGFMEEHGVTLKASGLERVIFREGMEGEVRVVASVTRTSKSLSRLSKGQRAEPGVYHCGAVLNRTPTVHNPIVEVELMANRQFKRQQERHDHQHSKAEGKGVTPLMMSVMVVLAMAAVGATMGTAPVDAAATDSAIQVVARATAATVAAIGCGLATMAERALKPERGHYPSVYPPNPAAEPELEPEVRFKTDMNRSSFRILKI